MREFRSIIIVLFWGRMQDYSSSVRNEKEALMREIKGFKQLLWTIDKGDDETEKQPLELKFL